jgi:hypothetical protein
MRREMMAMTIDDELQREQTGIARAELRRIVVHGKPPSGAPPEAFGPWAAYLGPIRRAFAERGLKAAQEACLALIRLHPPLGLLLGDDWEPGPVAPAGDLGPRRKAGWTAAELLAADLPRAGWIVPGLLPLGLSTLAGRPKMGKSWLALQIACAVGAGGSVLDRTTEQGPVLYLALEDSPRRLQERLRTQQAPPTDVTFALEWQPLAAGGLHALRTAIERGKVKLVVVDTLNRALGRAGRLDLVGMTLIIGELQNLCQTTGASILTIDHHKKPINNLANPIDDILGSTGKAALVDAALGLYRERGKHDATLHATGRDMPQVELVIRWDGEHCCWQAVGEAGEVRKESLQGAILAAIRELDELGDVTSTTAIARHLHKDKANVSRELADLIQAGKVVKGERDGRVVPYFLVGQVLPPYSP